MRVSIVTISYNQASFLQRAIESVLLQDYPNVEYIVVDPGSTDDSRELINQYQNRIHRVILEPDDGPADGLNKGFRVATGDIFGYLNADDMLFPNAVSQIVQAFQKKPDASVFSGHGVIVNTEGRLCRRVYSHRFDLNAYAYGVCVLVQQASFFRRNEFYHVGGFNPSNRVSWDGEFWVDLALNGAKFSRIHSYLAGFRIHKNAITGSGQYRMEIEKQHARICRKIGVNPQSKLKRRIIWALNRLSDPKATLARFNDEFRNGLLILE